MFWKTVIVAVMAVGVLANANKRTFLLQVQNFLQLGTQCNKLGRVEKFDSFEDTMSALDMCIREISKFNTLKDQIEKGKAKGNLDGVFSKPCQKSAELRACVHTMLDNMTSCEGARDKGVTAKKIADDVIDFACYKDGERVANFFAAYGIECYVLTLQDSLKCITKVENPEAKDFPNFVDDETLSTDEKCAKFDEISTCFVDSTKTCDSQTPSETLGGLFATIRKASPCNK